MTGDNPCSSSLGNTQELCLTTTALRNTGVHDLCISSEIFTPHWGAKWGKWSVTNVAPFNAVYEGTQHDGKYFQQSDSCPKCSGAHMLAECPLAWLVLYIHRVGALSPAKCLILSPENRRHLSLRIRHVMPSLWRQILTLTDHIVILGSIFNFEPRHLLHWFGINRHFCTFVYFA